MIIDLKDSLLRFIVPPALLWSVLIYFNDQASMPSDPFSLVIIFIASGFIISALGAVFTIIFDYAFHPIWGTAEGELNYWKSLEDYKYARNKIATKWLFYYLNINSAIAISSTLIWHHSGNFAYLLLILVFGFLAMINYKRCYDYGEETRKMKLAECNTESSSEYL